MRTALLFVLLLLAVSANAQNYTLRGEIIDETAVPMPSATVVLLDPSDSTMLYFGITGNTGNFEIRNIKKGNYLLQASFIGYTAMYRNLNIPEMPDGNLGTLVLVPQPVNIDQVNVTAERIPMQIRKDTIEYDAKAFKVKPDAVAEELIKKLPGIEVDRSGNIKALGEDVKNVLVDGKEFFGNDPKVATRNLPANAIDKIQLFDKSTDESQFTGIDDGIRNQTLNLVLDEDKKAGLFGDVSAGAGTGNHYQANAKVYHFTDKVQIAALGMYNNINQFGFSISDYISFSGGLGALSSGTGRLVLGGESSFPVNFGQPVYGFGSNGAAGFNFSVSRSANNRFFASYLGNGASRDLKESTSTHYFTPGESYSVNEEVTQVKRDTAHRLNFGWRNQIGEKQNIIINGGLSYNTGSNPLSSLSSSYLEDVLVNDMERTTTDFSKRISGNTDASYLLKINEGKTILKLSGRGNYSGSNSNTSFLNSIKYFNPSSQEISNQFIDIGSTGYSYSGTLSFTQKVTRNSFIDLSLNAGESIDDFLRDQGNINGILIPVDSLSPDFNKTERYLRPSLTWKAGTNKSLLSLGLSYYKGNYSTLLNDGKREIRDYSFILPRVSWEFDYRSGRRLMFNYTTNVSTPGINQLMPVVNNFNSLSLLYGNRDLHPEYIHSVRTNWWLFDQFSFTTLITGIDLTYTKDKINYSRNVNSELQQVIMPVNVKDDWTGSTSVNFTTPIRPIGMLVTLDISERYNRGINIINGTENINRNMNHDISLSLANRKKDKWDIETGADLSLTNSKYSVHQSLDNVYRDISWYSDLRYTPGTHLSMSISADITKYSAQNFYDTQLVPLIGAEINIYLLQNQRGVFTISGIDLLNRNTGIERQSELNYLLERNSSMIGRYIMFSFKYRLNRFGENNNGIDIQVKKR